MLAQGLSHFKNVPLSVLGMVLFLAVFVVVTVWTFARARSREFYQELAEMPLNQDGEKL